MRHLFKVKKIKQFDEFKSFSFHTGIMNRLHHFKQTFPENFKEGMSYKGKCEFVIVDYGSKDGIDEWLFNNYKDEIQEGIISLYQFKSKKYYMTHAKNIGIRLSSNECVCNLDADNYLGKNFISFVNNKFCEGFDMVLPKNWALGVPPDVQGKIFMTKKLAYKLKGYDEAIRGWGHDDQDLRKRAKFLKSKIYYFSKLGFFDYVPHSDKERTCNSLTENIDKNISNIINMKLSENLSRKVNTKGWGQGKFLKNLKEIVEVE